MLLLYSIGHVDNPRTKLLVLQATYWVTLNEQVNLISSHHLNSTMRFPSHFLEII